MTINRFSLVLALASTSFVLAYASTAHQQQSMRGFSLAPVSSLVHYQDEQDVLSFPLEQKDAVAEARRRLIMDDFVPLSCNGALDLQPCPSWGSVFGPATTTFPQRVIIDCGTCVTMDQPDLTLEQGLDIRGKLIFPESFAVTIRTSSITVQGELEMHSTGAIDGSPWIHIIMMGDESQFFTPIGENAANCGGGDCEVDRKAITVAGGKVNSTSWYSCSMLFVCSFVLFLASARTARYSQNCRGVSFSFQFMALVQTLRPGCDCTMWRVGRTTIRPASLWTRQQCWVSGFLGPCCSSRRTRANGTITRCARLLPFHQPRGDMLSLSLIHPFGDQQRWWRAKIMR